MLPMHPCFSVSLLPLQGCLQMHPLTRILHGSLFHFKTCAAMSIKLIFLLLFPIFFFSYYFFLLCLFPSSLSLQLQQKEKPHNANISMNFDFYEVLCHNSSEGHNFYFICYYFLTMLLLEDGTRISQNQFMTIKF